MMSQRNDGNLDEIAENQPPVVDDVRIELLEIGGPFDDCAVQIFFRLLQRGQRAAIDFRNKPPTPMAGIDAGGQKIIVHARNAWFACNPCIGDMVVLRDKALHARRKRQDGGVVAKELLVATDALILRIVHAFASVQ